MFRIGKSIKTESRLVVARGGSRSRREWEMTANRYRVSFSVDETG